MRTQADAARVHSCSTHGEGCRCSDSCTHGLLGCCRSHEQGIHISGKKEECTHTYQNTCFLSGPKPRANFVDEDALRQEFVKLVRCRVVAKWRFWCIKSQPCTLKNHVSCMMLLKIFLSFNFPITRILRG